jgi:sterol 14-demethylase
MYDATYAFAVQRYVKNDLPVPPQLVNPPTAKETSRSYVIPKGHLILASPAVSQMDPRVWKDASKWEPSRWADPEGVAKQALKQYEDKGGEMIDYGFGKVSKGTESVYQPFGAGRHRCIGEQVRVSLTSSSGMGNLIDFTSFAQFAYVQLGTIISILVRKLEIKINAVPGHNYRVC